MSPRIGSHSRSGEPIAPNPAMKEPILHGWRNASNPFSGYKRFPEDADR